jgi:hypothetical protein
MQRLHSQYLVNTGREFVPPDGIKCHSFGVNIRAPIPSRTSLIACSTTAAEPSSSWPRRVTCRADGRAAMEPSCSPQLRARSSRISLGTHVARDANMSNTFWLVSFWSPRILVSQSSYDATDNQKRVGLCIFGVLLCPTELIFLRKYMTDAFQPIRTLSENALK